MCMTLGYFFTNNILIILYLGEFEKSGTSGSVFYDSTEISVAFSSSLCFFLFKRLQVVNRT